VIILRYEYTDKELREIIKSLVILVDTREQENLHIIEFLTKKKIQIKSKKLDFGDYSFFLPKNSDLSINRDIYFDKQIVVERKGSLSELAGNLTADRERFEKELIRKKDTKMHLLIEGGDWLKINQGMYRSDYKPQSFLATLYAYMARYDISINFTTKELAGQFIYSTFYYFLREYLNNYFQCLPNKEIDENEESFRGF